MGLFARAAREDRGYRLETFSPQSTAYWVAKLFGGGMRSASGISITAESALSIATVYAACRNIAEDLARLPLPVYRDGVTTAGASMSAALTAPKDIDRSAPAFRLLNKMANPEMTAMTFRETLHGHEALRGDAYAEIEWDQALRPKALWPLNPTRMRMVRNGANGFKVEDAEPGRLFYLYDLPSGQTKVFDRDLIFHPRGFGPDGLHGYSLVSLFREAMGLALGAEEYAARFYSNDASPGLALTHPKTLSDKARANLATSFQATHQGLSNAHRMAILEEGLTLTKIGINPVDAQFIETRKFQRDEFLTIIRMPPDKVGNYERSTYNNLEQSDIAYVRYTLTPRGVRFEQQLAADNVVDAAHYAQHDYTALLQGDSVARAAYLHSLRIDGAISGEDIRRVENFPPSNQAGADQLLVPLNMMSASALRSGDGLTVLQLAEAAFKMLRAGYVAEDVNRWLGIGDIAHTGVVPGTTTPVPSEESGGGGPADGSAGGAATDGTDAARSLIDSILEGRNGHRPDLMPQGSR